MEKKQYEAPALEVLEFKAENVMSTSSEVTEPTRENELPIH